MALLDVLEGKAESLQVGADDSGADLRLVAGDISVWHQVKWQGARRRTWTINELYRHDVLGTLWTKLRAGARFVFVTDIGAPQLSQLARLAADALSWDEFNSVLLAPRTQRRNFEDLCVVWKGEPRQVYEALSGVKVVTIDEPSLVTLLDERLSALVEGRSSLAVAVLGQLIDDSLHRVLTAETVWQSLAEAGIQPRTITADPSVHSLPATDDSDQSAPHSGPARAGGVRGSSSSHRGSVGDIVQLEFVPELESPAALLEPLLEQATHVIDSGILDGDPLTSRTLERDRDYLWHELYENPDASDTAILLATSNRVLRIVSRVKLQGENRGSLERLLIASGDPLSPETAIAAADAVAEALETETDFDPRDVSTAEWVAIQLGWFHYLLPHAVNSAKAAIRESGPAFIGASSGVAQILLALGMAGLPAVLASTYLGLLAAAWKPRTLG